ncbi:hypothetical protein FGB62_46g06 [Gracilaria domingensis]|nr:hypothetical protein FGB62_46g06 [Gracilaria domingensis]
MFEKGEITGAENPSEVYKMDPVFGAYRLAAFQNRYTRMKKEIKQQKDSILLSNIQARISGGGTLAPLNVDIEGNVEINEEEDDDVIATGPILKPGQFYPLVLSSEWENEETTVQFVTLAISMFSGVKVEMISTQVICRGRFFEVVVQ